MKLDNEKEYNRGSLPLSALELRQKDLDKKIFTYLHDIKGDMQMIGLKVEMEQI